MIPRLHEDRQELETYLKTTGWELLGYPESPQYVRLQRRSSAWLADFIWPDSEIRVVIKPLIRTPLAGGIDSLWKVHESLRKKSLYLRDRTVAFRAYDPDQSLVFQEFVDGRPLDQHLRSISARPSNTHPCRLLLSEVAGVLTEIHRIRPADLGFKSRPRSPGVYLDRFDRALASPWLKIWLPRRFRSSAPIRSWLSEDFWQSAECRLGIADTQAKNILVRANNDLSFIDIDYSFVHPAANLSLMLASLDLVSRPRPRRDPSDLGHAWSSVLAAEYAARSGRDPRDLMDELTFFYPLRVLTLAEDHRQRHPLFSPFLGRFYALRLRSFLLAVEQGRMTSDSSILLSSTGR